MPKYSKVLIAFFISALVLIVSSFVILEILDKMLFSLCQREGMASGFGPTCIWGFITIFLTLGVWIVGLIFLNKYLTKLKVNHVTRIVAMGTVIFLVLFMVSPIFFAFFGDNDYLRNLFNYFISYSLAYYFSERYLPN